MGASGCDIPARRDGVAVGARAALCSEARAAQDPHATEADRHVSAPLVEPEALAEAALAEPATPAVPGNGSGELVSVDFAALGLDAAPAA